MPVFNDLGLVFVHIPKNAGRSVERALLRGNDSPDGGRRSILNRAACALMRQTAPALPRTHLIGTLDYTLVAQHLTYTEMDLLGLLPSGKATRFAICRNPFDRAVSSVSHFVDGRHHAHLPQSPEEFESTLFRWLDTEPGDHNERAHRRSQMDYLVDRRGRMAMDHLMRLETLNDDFASLMAKIGHEEITLPWQGRSQRDRHYRDYFTQAARQRVEKEFAEDLDALGYSF